MEKMNSILLMLLLILALSIVSSQCVWCHYCDSRISQECDIPFKITSEVKSCEGTVCQWKKFQQGGQFMIHFCCILKVPVTVAYIFFQSYKLESSSSGASPKLERSRFHELPPSFSVLGNSPC